MRVKLTEEVTALDSMHSAVAAALDVQSPRPSDPKRGLYNRDGSRGRGLVRELISNAQGFRWGATTSPARASVLRRAAAVAAVPHGFVAARTAEFIIGHSRPPAPSRPVPRSPPLSSSAATAPSAATAAATASTSEKCRSYR